MTVYVDDMYTTQLGRFERMKMSHMIADTEEELHEMAQKIGLKREWYQGDHYDVALGRRLVDAFALRGAGALHDCPAVNLPHAQ